MDLSGFKLYMSDVGLLAARTGTTLENMTASDPSFSGHKGNLTENYVTCALQSNGYELFYWESDGKYAVRLSGKNFGYSNRIVSLPLYAMFLI
jgi:predicted AAA+ superfamily ATPase